MIIMKMIILKLYCMLLYNIVMCSIFNILFLQMSIIWYDIVSFSKLKFYNKIFWNENVGQCIWLFKKSIALSQNKHLSIKNFLALVIHHTFYNCSLESFNDQLITKLSIYIYAQMLNKNLSKLCTGLIPCWLI